MSIRVRIAVALLGAFSFFTGCMRTRCDHHASADREAYCVIGERNGDPRWAAPNTNIDMDPRSRFHDPYHQDCPPMPQDDPASHQYMHCVDGKKGWPHWHDNGSRNGLTNPDWRAALGQYVELTDEGAVNLDIDAALRLAYMHSPLHQQQLETLYLTALDVTGERFRFDTQFFAGFGGGWAHTGSLSPAGIVFDGGANDYVVAGPFNVPESNRLTLSSDAQASRRLATAGEVLVGFANSFVFEFAGGDVSLASSLANFSFIQPLLRGAGRDVALEQLTQSERLLLANLRAYGQFRQGLFTQIVIGELGVVGPQRGFSSTSLQSFSGFGGVSGYLGLLQQAQQIRNTEDNLRLQLRTRDRLEALYNNDLIDIVQLDQFRQNIEVTRSNRLDQTNALKLAVDNYKTQTLGLPPDLAVSVNEDLVSPFQLVPVEATPILQSLLQFQTRVGDIGEVLELTARVQGLADDIDGLQAVELDETARTLDKLLVLLESVARRTKLFPEDVKKLPSDFGDDLPPRLKSAVGLAISAAQEDGKLLAAYDTAILGLESLLDEPDDETLKQAVADRRSAWQELLELSFGILLTQASARDMISEPANALDQAEQFIQPVRELFAGAEADMEELESVAPSREAMMDERQIESFRRDRLRLNERLDELRTGRDGFSTAIEQLNQLKSGLTDQTRRDTARRLTAWIQSYLQIVERLPLIPAQARLEIIAVDQIKLSPEEALQIALQNRLDFMNGRAALVDRWRAIQVASDALQANLSVTGGGDIRTAGNNPVNFRPRTSSLRLGLEYDAPLTRLLERNTYREALIQYQQNRRNLIQSHDQLHTGLRALLRTLEQRRLQLDIQRRAVAIALRRVDQTQRSLLTPPPQVQPGQRAQINPTTAINLLGAQGSLQSSQNSFLSAWLNYYAARLRLFRELGVMQLDPEGKWIEDAFALGEKTQAEPKANESLPPPVIIEEIEPERTAEARANANGAPPSYVVLVGRTEPVTERYQHASNMEDHQASRTPGPGRQRSSASPIKHAYGHAYGHADIVRPQQEKEEGRKTPPSSMEPTSDNANSTTSRPEAEHAPQWFDTRQLSRQLDDLKLE